MNALEAAMKRDRLARLRLASLNPDAVTVPIYCRGEVVNAVVVGEGRAICPSCGHEVRVTA